MRPEGVVFGGGVKTERLVPETENQLPHYVTVFYFRSFNFTSGGPLAVRLPHCSAAVASALMRLSVPKMSYFFGPYALHNSQIFFESSLSLAIVNLKPIVPGHVLIIPKRVEPRIMNLSAEEYSDLFLTTRVVAPKLEQFYCSEAMNIAVQDGSAAGQSVPHVHIHILPRKTGKVLTIVSLELLRW
jgi:diadenosine tetraphosphate (Ap4A) HIT family hydrolase